MNDHRHDSNGFSIKDQRGMDLPYA